MSKKCIPEFLQLIENQLMAGFLLFFFVFEVSMTALSKVPQKKRLKT